MLFGNDECVAEAIASNVQKSVGVFVLVDFVGGDLAVYNFTKDAVFHCDTSHKFDLYVLPKSLHGHIVCFYLA